MRDGGDGRLNDLDAENLRAERELLASIFCEEGEFEVSDDGSVWSVRPSAAMGVRVVAIVPNDPTADDPVHVDIECSVCAERLHIAKQVEDELASSGSVYAAVTLAVSLLAVSQDRLAQPTVPCPEISPSQPETTALDAVETTAPDEVEMTETAFVRIDHFNDLRGYLDALERIVTSLPAAGARIFWPEPQKPELHTRRQAVDVLLVLRVPAAPAERGGRTEIDEVLKRLRTECVDIDLRGHKCKERQAQLLRRQVEPALDAPMLDSQTPGAAVSAGARYSASPYSGHGELLGLLAALGGKLCVGGLPEAEVRCCVGRAQSVELPRTDMPFVHAAGSNDGTLLIVCEVKPNKAYTLIAPHPHDMGAGPGDALGVELAAPPREGQANSELTAAVARWLHVPKGDVSIAGASKARRKVLRVAQSAGLTVEEASRRLVAAADADRERSTAGKVR